MKCGGKYKKKLQFNVIISILLIWYILLLILMSWDIYFGISLAIFVPIFVVWITWRWGVFVPEPKLRYEPSRNGEPPEMDFVVFSHVDHDMRSYKRKYKIQYKNKDGYITIHESELIVPYEGRHIARSNPGRWRVHYFTNDFNETENRKLIKMIWKFPYKDVFKYSYCCCAEFTKNEDEVWDRLEHEHKHKFQFWKCKECKFDNWASEYQNL
jgi:hypothetical protein